MNENGNQNGTITADNSKQWIKRIGVVAKTMLLGLAVLFLSSFLLEWLGAKAGRNDVVALGQIGKFFLCVAIFALNSIIPLGFKILSLGAYDMTNYFSKLRCIFLFNIALVLIYYFSPIPITISTLKAITVISLAVTALCLITPFNLQVVTAGTVLLVCLVYFPRVGQLLENRVRQLNQPKLLRIEPGHIEAGKTRLFLDGKPVVYYLFRQDTNTYELFDSPGMHDIFPQQLSPVTEEVVRKLVEDEMLISPRNFNGAQSRRLSAKPKETVSEKKGNAEETRELVAPVNRPRVFATGRKRVLSDEDRALENRMLEADTVSEKADFVPEPVEQITPPGKMLLTVDNENCRQLNIYAEGRLIAIVNANTRRLIHLKRDSFSTKICVWGEMGCGQESRYFWKGDALTIPVSRNPECESQFGISKTYTDINM